MDGAQNPLDASPILPPTRAAAPGPEHDRNEPITVLPAEPPALDAIPEAERIGSLDVLRGLAMLGILVMNIQSFAMIEAAYSNPTAYGDLEGANYAVWLLSHVLADQKFMTIFAMLFGAGIVLMTSRREKAGLTSAGVHYRRMGALALFGLLHAYLLWYGDILFSYALCGMLVYPLRRLHSGIQLVLGIVCIAAPSVLLLLLGGLLAWISASPHVSEAVREQIKEGLQRSWQPSAEVIEAELAAYRGSWLQEFEERWPSTLAVQTAGFLFLVFWRAGGLMLVGMALFRLGFFSAARSSATYWGLVAAALCLGVPVILYGVQWNFAEEWDALYAIFIGTQFNYWGSILVSLGWVGLAMLVYQQPWLRKLIRPLAAVGRMAFTNYLMQTVICTTIFYGYGFGLFGRVDRVGQIGIVFGIWIFQILASLLWLHLFRLGPAEWLWRCLTYGKVPLLWRETKAASPDPAYGQ
ncbi:MAG TPA: DUF418 domain-containing protein [Gemmataceae bacterium]|nr:DUF418 domain-containing protein [Gemmataceae bacterium]